MVNKKMLRISGAILLSGMFFLIASNAHAQMFKFKGVELSGDIGESIYYNSNPGYASIADQGHDFANLMDFDLNAGVPFNDLHRYTITTHSNWYEYFDKQKYSQFNTRLVQSCDLVFNRAAFNLHHTFEHSTDPTIQESGLISDAILKKNVNTFGYLWKGDLGKLKYETGCDMEIYRANEAYKVLDCNTLTPYIEVGCEITPLLDGYTRYTYERGQRIDSSMNNFNEHTVVGGLRGELSKYLVGDVSAGYTAMIFNDKNSALDIENYYGLTFDGSLTNRITRYTTQMVEATYQPEMGYNVGNFYKDFTITYTLTHRLNRFINLSGLVEYENMMESSGLGNNEKVNYYSYGAHCDWLLAKNLSLRTDFKTQEKDSNRPGKAYKQITAQSGLFYTF